MSMSPGQNSQNRNGNIGSQMETQRWVRWELGQVGTWMTARETRKEQREQPLPRWR